MSRIRPAQILNSIIPAVQEYLRMPDQETFDKLIEAGFEREEAEFEAWSAELRRERARQHEEALIENSLHGSIAGFFGE